MDFVPQTARGLLSLSRQWRGRVAPSWADAIAFLLLAGGAVLVIRGAEGMIAPLSRLHLAPVTLDPANLPGYALRTTLRMFAALGASLIFTFIVATLAAKSRRAGLVIVPALDILQSVPILGFLTFTVTFFMGLFPASQLGVELAAIFAIFTSQAWSSASISRCARYPTTSRKSRTASRSRRGGASSGSNCPSPPRLWCGMR